ncbi:MAG: hypothetical protein EXR77_19945 [Myxococcales bacterium]|nr:hypothetical protein [Myxococcales bacterium]
MPTPRRIALLTVCILSIAALGAASEVQAAGFEFAGNSAMGLGRGMALTASVDDSTAIAHNPGLLSQLDGTQLQWSHQIAYAHETFTRAPSQVPQKSIAGATTAEALAPSSNKAPLFPLGVFLAASRRVSANWTVAVAGYGPSGIGFKEFDSQGGQRYMLTKLDLLIAYASLAVAYGKKDKFGVGATMQWAMMPKTDMSLVVDAATGGAQNPYYAGSDVVATIRLADMTAFSAIMGAWWQVSPNLRVAASGRVIPVYFDAEGDLALSNDRDGVGAKFTPTQLSVSGSKAHLKMAIAPTCAIGARWVNLNASGTETWDVEANIVWEGWSIIDAYEVKTEGKINMFAKKEFPTVTIAKKWRDTVALRVGGTYWASDAMGVSAGGYIEQGATPHNYSHLDFPSFNRLGLGGGIRYKGQSINGNLSYVHVFQETREVSEAYGKVTQQRPMSPCPEDCDGFDNIPANAGKFETGYDMLSLSVAYKF